MTELPHVTNHAVERYLERAKGCDAATVAEAMRSEIIVTRTRNHIAALCAPYIGFAARLRAEGVKFEFNLAGSVITVVPGKFMPSRTAEQRSANNRRRA
jgi:hypothetical protein